MNKKEADRLFDDAFKLSEKKDIGAISETFGEIHPENYQYLESKIRNDDSLSREEKSKRLTVLLALVNEFDESLHRDDLIDEKKDNEDELKNFGTADTVITEIPEEPSKNIFDVEELEATNTSATEELMANLNEEQKQENISESEYEARNKAIRRLEKAINLKKAQKKEYDKMEITFSDFSYLRRRVDSINKSSDDENKIELTELFNLVEGEITSDQVLNIVNLRKVQKIEDEFGRITPDQELGDEIHQSEDDAIYLLRSVIESKMDSVDNFKKEKVSPFQFEYLIRQVAKFSKDTQNIDRIYQALYSLLDVKKEESRQMTPSTIQELKNGKVPNSDTEEEVIENTAIFNKPKEEPQIKDQEATQEPVSQSSEAKIPVVDEPSVVIAKKYVSEAKRKEAELFLKAAQRYRERAEKGKDRGRKILSTRRSELRKRKGLQAEPTLKISRTNKSKKKVGFWRGLFGGGDGNNEKIKPTTTLNTSESTVPKKQEKKTGGFLASIRNLFRRK
ncbi:MAG: hypothetical protein HQ538_02295, partial [Parcubacteria group bacterium]|nr:hypothetical protein [Parcubacteria group bacterium]